MSGAAAVLASCGGGSAPVPDRFSGVWKLADGRTIPIRRVGQDEGEAALRALGGQPCTGGAVYYRATYFGGLAHLAGCASGDGKRMTARFNDNGRRGVILQRLTSERPPTFVAEIRGEGGKPFRVVATQVG
jgi:hypothetical protein